MTSKSRPVLSDFPYSTQITTRWTDNDINNHVNNAIYFMMYDTALNYYLNKFCAWNPLNPQTSAFIVSASNVYYDAASGFPDPVTVGLSVSHLGNSSVTFQLAVFQGDDERAKAAGNMVQVFVDKKNLRPLKTGMPQEIRKGLEKLYRPTSKL